ncbi:MAG: hypothetical protein F6K56_30760 [Moorea sp. SIO3G5]|nr:hypothetical protein [Moorena sp. SIO3G5]
MKSFSKLSAVSGQRSALWNRLPACEASVSYQLNADRCSRSVRVALMLTAVRVACA